MSVHLDTTARPARGAGALFVLEGPDGVGKSTLTKAAEQALLAEGHRVSTFSFPGREPDSLGRHIYELHHDPERFGVRAIAPAGLQLLHVAAHLDAIDRFIRPRIADGELVLLDRYWWSTWVYGVESGVEWRILSAMVDLERQYWGNLRPMAIFLIERSESRRAAESIVAFEQRSSEYRAIAEREALNARVARIDNNGPLEGALSGVVAEIHRLLATHGHTPSPGPQGWLR